MTQGALLTFSCSASGSSASSPTDCQKSLDPCSLSRPVPRLGAEVLSLPQCSTGDPPVVDDDEQANDVLADHLRQLPLGLQTTPPQAAQPGPPEKQVRNVIPFPASKQSTTHYGASNLRHRLTLIQVVQAC